MLSVSKCRVKIGAGEVKLTGINKAPSCLEVGGFAPQPSVPSCDLGSATLSRNVRPAGETWGSDAACSEGSVWSAINQWFL